MKFKTVLILFLGFLNSATQAADQPLTLAYFNVEAHKERFVISSNNKCHGPLSSGRNSVKIELDEAGNPTNIYNDEDACIDAGGTLTQEQITKKLIATMQTIDEEKERKAKIKKQEEQEQKFFGINWGLGLAYTYTSDPIIHEASIASGGENMPGTILVERQTKHRAIAMLESHYFFKKSWLKDCFIRGEEGFDTKPCDTTFGHGPFIAIGIAGEDGVDPLSTYGIGWMWGIRLENTTSWNIGIGAFIDTKARALRPGFVDGGQTTIANLNEITYERDETGWMLMFSSTF